MRVNFLRISCVRGCLCLCAAFFLFIANASFADEDSKSDTAQVDAIRALADRDNATALKQIQEFKSQLGPNVAYVVRVEVLKTQIGLLYDAGDAKEARVANAELLALAKSHADRDMVALAHIGEAYELLDQGKAAQAIIKLNEIEQGLKGSKNPEVFMRLNSAIGEMYESVGDFEHALSHYLEAVRLTEQLPQRRVQAKLYRLQAIASLYLSMRDPQKALATANAGLELVPQVNSPKLIATFSMVQGIALAGLGKNEVSLQAYLRTLKIAREGGMEGVEATALGNIADHYLTAHKFVEAEHWARLALAKTQKIDDHYGDAAARANIGLALAAQGKFSRGIEYINEAKKFFLESGDKTDLESLLGEIAGMYEAAGMYKEALNTLQEKIKLSDELFRTNRTRVVATLQEQFDAEQRQKQIELLGRENQLKDADIDNRRLQQIITLLAATATVLACGFVFLLYIRVRKTNEKLKVANSQLEFHAVRDPLTGLYNRRSFVDLMQARAGLPVDRREDGSSHTDSLILMDIDHFKQINDTWGHAAGDGVLKEVARRLGQVVRDTDMVLRWGGEEFLVFSPKSGTMQISALVDRLLRAIGQAPFQIDGKPIHVTVTAGFISVPFSDLSEEICNWEKALQIADMALYLGKAHGRNRAYGVVRLLVPHEQAMPIIDHDLSAAISEGMVELIEMIGPEQLRKPAE